MLQGRGGSSRQKRRIFNSSAVHLPDKIGGPGFTPKCRLWGRHSLLPCERPPAALQFGLTGQYHIDGSAKATSSSLSEMVRANENPGTGRKDPDGGRPTFRLPPLPPSPHGGHRGAG